MKLGHLNNICALNRYMGKEIWFIWK